MFHFGKSAGYIEGVLSGVGISYYLVTPQKWKKYYQLGSDKQQSVDKCHQLFPSISLLPSPRCHKDSDGMAEALLIANYGKLKLDTYMTTKEGSTV